MSSPIVIVALMLLAAAHFWMFYNIPILVVGISRLRHSSSRVKVEEAVPARMEDFPTISVVVPVKDEEKVVDRLLKSLLKLDYPADKREILIVEDGSSDRTVEICEEYARRYPGQVRLLRKPVSSGKPSALNYALGHAKGEIVAVFDADSVPERSVLKRAIRYFNDPSVAAVQGRLCSINADENMLTKLISYEETIWCEAYLKGKDALKLFVYLRGTCQFIRRDVLERLGGFDERALSEDMELSARLIREGYTIKYASDVRSWQESPSGIKQLFKQRTRWYGGTIQVALKYGKLMVKPKRENLDAELTLLGPFVIIASLVGYLLALYASVTGLNPGALPQLLMQLATISISSMLIVCGLALACISKPRKLANILWMPLMYFYWSLQALVALYAMLLTLLRRPLRWEKTQKTGKIKAQLPLNLYLNEEVKSQ